MNRQKHNKAAVIQIKQYKL